MNIQIKISAVLLIATAFLTSSIVAGPSIVYANSYGGLGGLGGLGSPLGIGGIGDLSPLSPSLGIQGKPIFPLSQFNLEVCSSTPKSQLVEPCINVSKGSGNFTFICEPTSIVSFSCASISPPAFKQIQQTYEQMKQTLMGNNTTSTSPATTSDNAPSTSPATTSDNAPSTSPATTSDNAPSTSPDTTGGNTTSAGSNIISGNTPLTGLAKR
jgi:hypothetical protein